MGHTKYLLLGLGIIGMQISANIPLFERFALLQQLHYVQLGDWPTPVEQLQHMGNYLNNAQLYIKREDLSGKLFGGNKVRKLEFLLADALKQNHKTVLAYGGIASNNITSVAAYAQQLDLQSIAFLMPQPVTRNLKRNLMLDVAYGCSLFECPFDRELTPQELQAFLQEKNLDPNPYVIPMGGSNKIGIIGWVNAAFELKQQIDQGILPEPDYLYITMGSLGTAAGLLLGLKATGLKTKLKIVQVTDSKKYTKEKLCILIQETNTLLHSIDSKFPLFEWDKDEFDINTQFFGGAYARTTPQAELARDLFLRIENIILDETYTAKTAAALIMDCTLQVFKPTDTVLFWNTYCSQEFSDVVQGISPHNMPVFLQSYMR